MSEEAVGEQDYSVELGYLELPLQLRELAEVQMCPYERRKLALLTEVSKQTKKNQEENTATNNIYEICLKIHTESLIGIHMIYGDSDENSRKKCYLVFIVEDGKTILRYGLTVAKYSINLWSVDTSEDIFQIATQYFHVIAQIYQDDIQSLTLESKVAREFDFGFTSLKKLEKMLVNKVDVSKLVSIVQHPLKQMIVCGRSEMNELEDLIFNAKDTVGLSDMKINNDQFLRLSARVAVVVNVGGGGMTEDDVFNYINSWRNGKIEIERTTACFTWKNAEFKPQSVFRRLGREINGDFAMVEKIPHRKDDGKYANLSLAKDCLFVIFFDKKEMSEQQSTAVDKFLTLENLMRL